LAGDDSATITSTLETIHGKQKTVENEHRTRLSSTQKILPNQKSFFTLSLILITILVTFMVRHFLCHVCVCVCVHVHFVCMCVRDSYACLCACSPHIYLRDTTFRFITFSWLSCSRPPAPGPAINRRRTHSFKLCPSCSSRPISELAKTSKAVSTPSPPTSHVSP